MTPRTRRFAGIWLRQFAFWLSMLLLGLAIGSTVGYLIVLAARTFGGHVVLIGLGATWLIAVAAGIAGAAAESRLTAAERQEAEVLRKLSRGDQ